MMPGYLFGLVDAVQKELTGLDVVAPLNRWDFDEINTSIPKQGQVKTSRVFK